MAKYEKINVGESRGGGLLAYPIDNVNFSGCLTLFLLFNEKGIIR